MAPGAWLVSRARCWRRLVAAVVLALGLGLVGGGWAAAKGPIAGATVYPKITGPRVPPSYMGISLDYKWLPLYTGLYSGSEGGSGPNQLTAALLRGLAPPGERPPVVRVGSGGADNIWWNPEARPRPPGIYEELRPQVLRGLAEFQQLLGGPLMVGLNLALNRPEEAARMAEAALQYLPRRQTLFEVGNEPDIYTERPWFPDGRPPRKKPYRFEEYLREFGRHVRRLMKLRPRPRLAGPSAGLGSGDAWLQGMPRFMRRFGRPVRALTYHGYPLSACSPRRAPDHPTIRRLLTNDIIHGYAKRFGPLARMAGVRGRPLILNETGSAACGGKEGVSDTFAAALWGAHWLFTMQYLRIDGVYFQAAGSYSPFNIAGGVGRPPFARVLPLYHGMRLFAAATAGRSRVVFAPPNARLRFRSRANVVFFAFRTAGGKIRVVVLNKDLRKGGRVKVRVKGAGRRGKLVRLTAPSVKAKTGVTFAGQGFPEYTSDAVLTGEYESRPVPRRRRGVYVFRMPKTSGALLTIPRG